jgi:hypothetical protein
MQVEFAAGQRWTYRAPAGFEASRIVIGAVVSCSGDQKVVCAAVAGAPRRLPDGQMEAVVIPFLPFTEAAFAATVTGRDGEDVPPPAFAPALEAWATDARGLSMFTVPFEGNLDVMIARQMAQIVGTEA